MSDQGVIGLSTARARPRDAAAPLYVLFFFSGFPALLYQLVWQRALFRLFGVNVESVTIVVTAFMVGLGLGALAGGALSKRDKVKLLPLLAVIEGLTALFGLVSLGLFERVGEWALGAPLALSAVVALGLVLVPTMLMGATLPLLAGHLTRKAGAAGAAVGQLYYVNTLGAGAACLAGMALIFPFTGMRASVLIAAAVNVCVALGALVLHRRESAAAAPLAAPAAPARRGLLPFATVTALAALGGFVSLSYEIFFFRAQSYASGGSASAFAATLCAFLVGIASGSRHAADLCGRPDAPRRVLRVLLAACAFAALYLPALRLGAAVDGLAVGISALFVFLIARAWGMLLPFLAELGVAADEDAGRRIAWLYLANIVGSASGSILTGFVLMDHLSLVGIAQALAAAGLACVLLLSAALPRDSAGFGRERLAAAALAASVLAIPALSAGLLEKLQFGARPLGDLPFKRVIENKSGVIAVDANGAVWGHGMYDGVFNTDIMHDANGVVRPFALSLLHPAPKKVLMIGLASGSWARVIASNPHVEELTVVEINPGYRQLVSEQPEVASVLSDPKVRLVVDDGRRWLALNKDARFDAIVSNTTWHFRANVTNLLSAEFIALARSRLAPGGIFFFNTTESARVQKTACEADPRGLRFANHMAVGRDAAAPSAQRWRDTLLAYRIDGRAVFDRADPAQMAALDDLVSAYGAPGPRLESCASILARTATLASVTDDNMGAEWRKALGLE